MATRDEDFTEEMVTERLSRFHDNTYTFEYAGTRAAFRTFKRAAVLVPLFIKKGQVRVLLTVRSARMRQHPGEVAFPGGMRDPGDRDEVRTALREAHEEVALPPDDVNVIARLLPRVTRHHVYMIPLVGIIPEEFRPTPNDNEVHEVFSLPLSRFLSDRQHSTSEYTMRGVTMSIHFFHDEGEGGQTYTTWGLTAGVCVELAVALFGRKPDFPSELTPENPFALQKRYLRSVEQHSSL